MQLRSVSSTKQHTRKKKKNVVTNSPYKGKKKFEVLHTHERENAFSERLKYDNTCFKNLLERCRLPFHRALHMWAKKNCVSSRWANEVRLGSSEKMSRDSSNSPAVHNLQRFRCSKERMWLTKGQHMQEKLPHRFAALSVREEWHSTKSSERLQSSDLLQVQDKHCKLLLFFFFSFFLSTGLPCDIEEEKRVQHLHDKHTYCSKFKKTDDA